MAFLAILFVLPNGLLLSTSLYQSEAQLTTDKLTLENYEFVLSRPGYVAAILRTFFIGTVVGLIDVILAFPIAYLLVRSKTKWLGVLLGLAVAPLLASVIVRTYGWYVIFARDGWVATAINWTGMLDHPIQIIPSVTAIIIGLAHALLPYSILTIMSSLKNLDLSLEKAAMILGATRTKTFLTVILPLCLPGVASGFILSFSISISAYATPRILGGPQTATLATQMYTFMAEMLDWSLGSAFGVILLVTALMLMFIAARLGTRQHAL
jgi:ABC-type spermidine/putrescine transport system permease subunit I